MFSPLMLTDSIILIALSGGTFKLKKVVDNLEA